MGLVTAYEDGCTRSRRIVKSAVTETSIVKGSLKTTTRYLPCGRYDKYDENEGADREKVKTEKSKLKTGNTSNAILGEHTGSPAQRSGEEYIQDGFVVSTIRRIQLVMLIIALCSFILQNGLLVGLYSYFNIH